MSCISWGSCHIFLCSQCILHIILYINSFSLCSHFWQNFDTLVISEGDGTKIYVSCIAFRDPVCDDIVEAYQIPEKSFADKCICFVSRSPSFNVLRDALEELFVLCFSSSGSRYVFFGNIIILIWYDKQLIRKY